MKTMQPSERYFDQSLGVWVNIYEEKKVKRKLGCAARRFSRRKCGLAMKMIACSPDSHAKMGNIDMSTRSFICIEDAEQGYRGIYCHYDGYPSHVGKLLVEFHNSISAAEAIVHGPQIRNFDSDGMVVRYGDGTPDDSEVYLGLDDALNSGFDYVYFYSTQENCWKCFSKPRSTVYGYLEEREIPGNRPWETA